MSSFSKYFPLIFLAAVLLTTAIVSADHHKHHPRGRLMLQDEEDTPKPVPKHKPHMRHDEAPQDHHPGHVLVEEEEDGNKPFPEHKPPKLEEKPRKGKGEKPPSEEDEDKLSKGKEGKPPHDNHHGHMLVEEVDEVEEDSLQPKKKDKPLKGKGKKPLHGHLLTEEEEDEEEESTWRKGEKLPKEKPKKTSPEHKPPHDQQHPGHVHVEEVEDAYISSRKAQLAKPWAP